MKICKIENCNSFVFGKGYCKVHQYLRTDIKKSIRKVSNKRQKEQIEYSKIRQKLLNKFPVCYAHLVDCTIQATEVHHMEGRGKNYLDESKMVTICHSCHVKITEDSKLAKKLNLSGKRNNEII